MMDARLSYREAAAHGANPLRLVVLLYEQAIDDLRRALAALRKRDVETRTREINHAILVIGHLQASLDQEIGGAPARNLDRFYNQVREGLLQAQMQQSEAMLETQISHLLLLHEAWREVECKETAGVGPAPGSEPHDAQTGNQPQASAEWNA
jgi:flagellar protein FliS